MAQVIFIGDEVTAAGYRLAGVACYDPDAGSLPGLLAEMRKNGCDLMMITAQYAGRLSPEKVTDMTLWSHPLVVILPDIRNHQMPPDLEVAVRRELGIEV